MKLHLGERITLATPKFDIQFGYFSGKLLSRFQLKANLLSDIN